MSKPTVNTIDAILPQTQCGLCTYGACLPYAKAIVEDNAPINLCPPGGVETLKKLGELTSQDATPFLEDMQKKTKLPTRAFIREEECIGCTKCIQACPVDAILGASKQMHTVLSDECTGCDLCLEPCPMDCIDMIPVDISDPTIVKQRANRARQRYNFRQERLGLNNQEANKLVSQVMPTDPLQTTSPTGPLGLDATTRQKAIQEAVARAAAKRRQQHQG